MGKPRMITCSDCGKDRPNAGHGRCSTCTSRIRLKVIGHCKQCDRDMPGILGGICNSCQSTNYRHRMGRVFLDKHAARERERRQRMGDEYRERDRVRNVARRDYRLKYCRDYYQKNIETFKENHRIWRKSHPKLRNIRKRRYTARKAQLVATLTAMEWECIKDSFDHCCVYCNRKMQRLTQEHIIPVMHGGHYTQFNIVPACQSCNSRKHTSTAFEFLIRLADEKRTGIRIPEPSRNR